MLVDNCLSYSTDAVKYTYLEHTDLPSLFNFIFLQLKFISTLHILHCTLRNVAYFTLEEIMVMNSNKNNHLANSTYSLQTYVKYYLF